MKKILALSVAALMVMGLVGGGTWAYFSDTETTAGNTFSAGTLELDYDGGDEVGSAIFTIAAVDGYPGNSGSAFKLIKNAGSLAGELEITISSVTNTESTAGTEYTGDSINGTSGELGGFATIRMWIDKGKDGSFTDGTDVVLIDGGTTSTAAATYTTAAASVNSFNGDTWDDALASMPSLDEYRFYIDWTIPGAATDNTAQGDSVSFPIAFILEQVAAD